MKTAKDFRHGAIIRAQLLLEQHGSPRAAILRTVEADYGLNILHAVNDEWERVASVYQRRLFRRDWNRIQDCYAIMDEIANGLTALDFDHALGKFEQGAALLRIPTD